MSSQYVQRTSHLLQPLFRTSVHLRDHFSVSMFVLLFLKAGANIGTIISSMQAFRQKKFKVFFLPLFKAKRINKLAQKSVRKKLIEKIPNKAETHPPRAVGVVRRCEIVVFRNT